MNPSEAITSQSGEPATGEAPESKVEQWDLAVKDAVTTVAERELASEAAARKLAPKRRKRLLAGSVAVLTIVAAWDFWTISRPPEGLPEATIAEDLRYAVQFAAESIEDFRAERGRLPSQAETSAVVDEDLIFDVDGDDYSITAVDGTVRVTYDGSTPLDGWVAHQGGTR
jgi:hypothetical protein